MSLTLINSSESKVRKGVDILAPGADSVNTIKLPEEDFQPLLAPERTVIDVVNDFSWYSGPKAESAALNKLPCAFLIEREQRLSSLISGALYYLNASAKAFARVADAVAEGQPISLLGNGDYRKALQAGSKLLNKYAGAIANDSDEQLLAKHNLKSLQGIYLTNPTGFQYRLPFYDTTQTVGNSWGTASNKTPFEGIINAGTEIIENISRTVNIAQPGVYIEKPKYFQHADQGESRTITFPLINTIRRNNSSPIQQNYELLWLLAFQNKAYKTSFARTPPPKIYTVSVPGQFSMPYAYISNMNIEFLGTVRRSRVSVPLLKGERITSTDIEVPVPDAYNVSITFTSLISDYGNAMISDAMNVRVTDNGVVFGA